MFGLSGVTSALMVVIALLSVTNIVTGKLYLSARDRATVAVSDRDSARQAASACSDSVDALRDLAAQRAKDSADEVAAARKASQAVQRKAQSLLSARPSVPADDCRSAAVQMDSWLTDRKVTK